MIRSMKEVSPSGFITSSNSSIYYSISVPLLALSHNVASRSSETSSVFSVLSLSYSKLLRIPLNLPMSPIFTKNLTLWLSCLQIHEHCPIENLITLWPEQLSWLPTAQISTALNSWLLTKDKYISLEPRLQRKVVRELSSFNLCSSLLIRNSYSILPLAMVWLSCHVLEQEILYIDKRIPAPFAWCIIFSTLFRTSSICQFMSKYIFATIDLALSITTSSKTESSSEICLTNREFSCLLSTKMAATM